MIWWSGLRKWNTFTGDLMNSNTVLNREVVTPCHGENRAAESVNLNKKTKPIHLSNNSLFRHYWIQSIGKIQHDHKNTARILHLWHYIIQDPKALQAKKIAHNFVLKFALNFLADLAVENRQKLRVTGLIERATRNCSCFLYGACVNPRSVKVGA